MKSMVKFTLAFSLALSWGLPASSGAEGASGQGYPASQGQQGQQAPPGAKGFRGTKEEAEAFTAIQNELDPDRAIQLVAEFEKKFPDSQVMSGVCTYAMNAFQQKGDLVKAVEYGEKSLKANPDNLGSLMMMASVLPQNQVLNANQMDKEKKLAEAEKYANHALEVIEKVPKQPDENDEQHKKRKDSILGDVHASLGMVHLQRSLMALEGGPDRDELAKAEQEYRSAVSMTERPDPAVYYRLGEACLMQNKVDEATEAFTKASELGEGTALKSFADERLEQIKKKKSEAKPPVKP